MTFLKKLGQVLLKVIGVVSGVEPLIQPYLGSASGRVSTDVNDLVQIGQVVVQAETILQDGTGPDKLKAAAPLVANIIKTSELVSGKKIANEALFTSACTQITSAVADILNSLDAGAVKG